MSVVERPDTVHGRLLESVHISGYSFERAFGKLKWLLEDDRWKKCGDGYEDIDDFLGTIDFSEFKIAAEKRRELSKMLADKRATQRTIAKSVGVDHATIGRDIKHGESAPKQRTQAPQIITQKQDTQPSVIHNGESAPMNQPPSFFASGQDVAKAAEKTLDKQYQKAKTYNHNEGDEWYTPKWLFDALGLTFSVDVCGPADRQHVSTPAEEYYTESDDGLSQKWTGTVWCNPPYSTPEPWVRKTIEHGDGLLLTHIPMNAQWATEVWERCDGIRLFQAIEFVRPDGTKQRPGMWLQLAAFGDEATKALAQMETPDDVAENPRRVPSPMFIPKRA